MSLTTYIKSMKTITAVTAFFFIGSSIINTMPASAQFKGENEKTWSASIRSDIANGAKAKDICINAESSATTSNEVRFKNWAYSVARKYCNEGFEKRDISEIETPAASTQCGLSSSQLYDIGRGVRVTVKGENCYSSFN